MCYISHLGGYRTEVIVAKESHFKSGSWVGKSGKKDFTAMDLSQVGQAHGRSVIIIVEAAIQCGCLHTMEIGFRELNIVRSL